MAMLTDCTSNHCTLEEAQKKLDGFREKSVDRVFETMFGMSALTDDDADFESRAKQRILNLWEDSNLANLIENAEKALWEPLGTEFSNWLRKVFVKSISEAIYSAIQSLELECGEDYIVVDSTEVDGETYIIISETLAA